MGELVQKKRQEKTETPEEIAFTKERTEEQTELIEKSTDLIDEIDAILEAEKQDEEKAITLADLIREGSQKTKQAQGWGDGVETACALTAAYIAARDRKLVA